MNPSRIFIERPVATSLLMLAVMLAGVIAFFLLPLSALPQVDYPTIQVQTLYPGASPEVMTSSVTAPLERQFGQMPSLTQMSSSSSAGASVITLQFDLSLSLDVAEQEVQAAINAAGNLLPADLPAPPIYAKVNPADAPVLTLAVTSKTIPLEDLHDLADTRLSQKISQLKGVGLVATSGGHRPAVRIQANPLALAGYGLNIDDVRTLVAQANVNTPKGTFDGASKSYTINANDQLRDPNEYLSIVVTQKNGAVVRLGDVARVVHGAENTHLGAWIAGASLAGTNVDGGVKGTGAANGANGLNEPAVIVNVQRQPGANVIDVVDRINALLPQLRQSLPAAVDVRVISDRTNTIRASVKDVELELTLAVVLVVLVMFVFLRSVRATIIPSLSVPLSLVGTFAAMYLLGYSLNNLSLMALTIASGFVVDDAIVMIENVSRFVEAGDDPLTAAFKGSKQIGFTIISLTISLLAVLIPLLFMGDVVGRLFREFAITLAVTIVISAVVSLTLVPMMCARLLRHVPGEPEAHDGRAPSRFAAAAKNAFDKLIAVYDRALSWVLDHQAITLAVFALTLGATALLYVVIPKGFFPVQDTGLIQAVTEAPQTVSFADMTDRQAQLASAIAKDKDVAGVISFVGIDGTNVTLNTGRFLITLKPKDDRSKDAAGVIRRIDNEVSDVEASAGIAVFMQPVQDLTIDSTVSRTQYQFVLEDANPAELAQWNDKLTSLLQKRGELEQVASNAQQRGATEYVDVDRDAAARFGITMATVDNALYDAFGQRIVSTIFTQSNQYRVVLEADPRIDSGDAALASIYLPSSSGGQVLLLSIAHVEERTAPLEVDHLGQFPATTISFNVAEGSSLGAAVDAIENVEREANMPASVTTTFQGAARAFQASLSNELLLILAAVVTMYIILGVLYESFVHPVTILSTLPSAGVGALLALILDGSDLGIVSVIGIVLLIGIVKKNAIMMIDFALDAERNEHKPPREAIHQASLLRFRPILMTTMAALLGAVPLMLGSGTGSELRHPLGVAIVGGLIVSQMLTLFTTPVIYLAFDRLSLRLRGKPPAAPPSITSSPSSPASPASTPGARS